MKVPRLPPGILAALFSLLVVLTITVVIQNTDMVRATVLFRTITMPLAQLLILVLASGMLTGAVLYHAMSNRRGRS